MRRRLSIIQLMGTGSCLAALWGVLALSSASMGLTVEELYPFGSQQGDRRLAVEDDVSSPEFFLNTSIAFYDDRFDSLYVSLLHLSLLLFA